jgi:hypothetical protein
LENPRKEWKEGSKEKFWTTYYKCQMIFTKRGVTSHGAFFKQCLEFNIVFVETSNGTKMIEFHKGGKIKSRVMKKL